MDTIDLLILESALDVINHQHAVFAKSDFAIIYLLYG